MVGTKKKFVIESCAYSAHYRETQQLRIGGNTAIETVIGNGGLIVGEILSALRRHHRLHLFHDWALRILHYPLDHDLCGKQSFIYDVYISIIKFQSYVFLFQ